MWQVRLSRAAHESIQTLSESNRRAVLATVGRLTMGPYPPGAPEPHRLPNRPDLIVLRAGARHHVAYAVSEDEQTITVVDVVARVEVPDLPVRATA